MPLLSCGGISLVNRTNMEIEERDVVGYEDYYSVTNDGRVYAKTRTWIFGYGAKRTKERHELIQHSNRGTYKSVVLRKDNKSKGWLVHRLVATAFIPNDEHKPCVNHINRKRQDNRRTNLEWVTHQENSDHALKMGSYKNVNLGEKNGQSKLTREQAEIIKVSKDTNASLSRKYGISRAIIRRIKRNEIWK